MTLRFKIALTVASVTLTFAVAFASVVPLQTAKVAETWLAKRALDTASAIGESVLVAYEFDDRQAAEEKLTNAKTRSELIYIALLNPRGERFAFAGSNNDVTVPAALTRANEATSVVVGKTMHVAVPITTHSGQTGTLAAGVSTKGVDTERRNQLTWSVWLAIATLVPGLLFSLWIGGILARPVRRLTEITTRIVDHGDLNQKIDVSGSDDIAELARQFSKLVEKLTSVPTSLGGLASGVSGVVDNLAGISDSVAGSERVLVEHVRETSAAMEDQAVGTMEANQALQRLRDSVHNSTASNRALTAASASVDESMQAMEKSLTSATTSVRTIVDQFGETKRSIEEVRGSSTETVSTVNELATSFRDVDRASKDMAEQAATVLQKADDGVAALTEVVQGVGEIEGRVQSVSLELTTLAEDLGRIDEFVSIIAEVTDRTNLLALNAAIIAAQAGDRGRGFAVVADEIKQLAHRTRSSTAEITQLIERIQTGSLRAQQEMEAGSAAVTRGVALTHKTEAVLSSIADSARTASRAAQAIASATTEQSSATSRANQSLERIAAAIERLHEASRAQSVQSADVLARTAELEKEATRVGAASSEHKMGSAAISAANQEIESLLEELATVLHNQSAAAETTLAGLQGVDKVAHAHGADTRTLHDAVRLLEERSRQLHEAVSQFHL